MMTYRAAWVCPIAAAPIRDGWVSIAGGRIAGVGGPGETAPSPPHDLGRAAVLPGLVNAHTHLELSGLRGRVPPAPDFVDWVKQLVMTRRGRMEDPADPAVIDAALSAAREARACGTVAVGDISNSLATIAPIRDAGLKGVVFHELLGFNDTEGRAVTATRAMRERAAVEAPDGVRVSVCGHAPYSTSPEIFQAVRREVDASAVGVTSVHLGESAGEVALLADGSGPWPGMLSFIGVMREGWTPPRQTPVGYLDGLGVLDAGTLVVHGVQLDEPQLARLATIGCTLVTCPRSNQWVGVGVPPVARFFASGVRVAVGTDSLASVEDLNLFEELRALRWIAPEVPARRLLESATRSGAVALGLGAELGSIEPGKRAELVAVELTRAVEDVEEYLVQGIDERQIRWVATPQST
jgi:cytosine/adenosine deaminase-related metal-dependent hydrolase